MKGNFIAKGKIINDVKIIHEDSKEVIIPYDGNIELFNRFSKFKFKGKSGNNIDVICVYRHFDIGIVFKKIGFDAKMFREEEIKKFNNRPDTDYFTMEEEYKIKIKRCSGGIYDWYADRVGEVFDANYHGNSKVDFVVTKHRDYNRPAVEFLISISDCDIIK